MVIIDLLFLIKNLIICLLRIFTNNLFSFNILILATNLLF